MCFKHDGSEILTYDEDEERIDSIEDSNRDLGDCSNGIDSRYPSLCSSNVEDEDEYIVPSCSVLQAPN